MVLFSWFRFVDRPLLTLSPNKTFEGFLGAIVWTCLFAFLFTGHVASYKWFTCPAEALTLVPHAKIDCQPHPVFAPVAPQALPGWWPPEWPVRPVQLHMIGVALFASLVGPFGGFVASGIKRAYGIKDFASFLPGHGGLMDRNDCQMLTHMFVGVYLATFLKDL